MSVVAVISLAVCAFLFSIISLIAVVALWALFIAKNYMSETIIQYKSVDEVLGNTVQTGRPMAEPFKEVGDELTEDEAEYFKQQQAAH